MIGQGELRTPHAAREHEQKLFVPPSGDIITIINKQRNAIITFL